FRPSAVHRLRGCSALLATSLLALPSCTNDSPSGGQAGTGAAGSSAGSAGAGGESSGGAGGSAGQGAVVLHTPWDWTGIIGTGQSLSVGEPDGVRNTAAAAARSTTQPFNNKQLSTGSLPWP